MVKEAGLAARLIYDDYERRSGLIRILPPETTPEAAASGAAEELGDLRDGAWSLDAVLPKWRKAGVSELVGSSRPLDLSAASGD